MKTAGVLTLGCKVNTYESEYIKEKFKDVSNDEWQNAQEIRIRNNKPIIISLQLINQIINLLEYVFLKMIKN